jgi:histidine ammonia-lyase
LELLAAAQALDLRGLAPGEGSRAAREAIRDRVPFLEADRELRIDIDAAVELVRGGALLENVERAVGFLD